MVATSRASRPVFSWIVLALGAGLALLFAAAFVLVARHGGSEARLGWEPGPADDGSVVIAAVDPSGPAAGVLAPGDRVVAVDGDRRVNWASFDWLMLPVPTRASYTLAAARNGREFEARLPVVFGTRPGWQWTAIVRA